MTRRYPVVGRSADRLGRTVEGAFLLRRIGRNEPSQVTAEEITQRWRGGKLHAFGGRGGQADDDLLNVRRDRVGLARRAFPWLERDREPRAIEDSGQPLPSLQLLLRERLRLTGLVGDRQSPGGSELEPGKLELQPLRPLDADGIVAWLELGIEVGHGLGRRVRRDDRARDRGRLRLRAIHGHRAQEEGRQRQNGGLAKFRDHCRFPFAYIATMSAISPVWRDLSVEFHTGASFVGRASRLPADLAMGPPGRRQRGNEDALPASESSVSVEVRQSIHERVLDQDRVVAVRAGGQQRHRALDQLLQALDVLDRVGGELGEAAGAAGGFGRAFQFLVDRAGRSLGAIVNNRWANVRVAGTASPTGQENPARLDIVITGTVASRRAGGKS